MLKNLFRSNAQQPSIHIQPETDSVDDLSGFNMEEVEVGLHPKISGNHFGLKPQVSLKSQNLNQYNVEPGYNALDLSEAGSFQNQGASSASSESIEALVDSVFSRDDANAIPVGPTAEQMVIDKQTGLPIAETEFKDLHGVGDLPGSAKKISWVDLIHLIIQALKRLIQEDTFLAHNPLREKILQSISNKDELAIIQDLVHQGYDLEKALKKMVEAVPTDQSLAAIGDIHDLLKQLKPEHPDLNQKIIRNLQQTAFDTFCHEFALIKGLGNDNISDQAQQHLDMRLEQLSVLIEQSDDKNFELTIDTNKYDHAVISDILKQFTNEKDYAFSYHQLFCDHPLSDPSLVLPSPALKLTFKANLGQPYIAAVNRENGLALAQACVDYDIQFETRAALVGLLPYLLEAYKNSNLNEIEKGLISVRLDEVFDHIYELDAQHPAFLADTWEVAIPILSDIQMESIQHLFPSTPSIDRDIIQKGSVLTIVKVKDQLQVATCIQPHGTKA